MVEPDYGSNAADDDFLQVLEAYADDPVFDELKTLIDDLNVDEQCELLALTWIGRGDFTAEDWEEAISTARDAHNAKTTAGYLLGIPMLGDYLEEGLAAFDLNCEDVDLEHF